MNSKIDFQRQREDIHYYKALALPINADHEYKCIPVLVERMADEFWAALQLHSKVLAVRIDLHTDDPVMKNDAVEDLLRWLKQDLKRTYRMKNIGHVWAREFGKKKKRHWHLVLLLDGNILQNSWMLIEKIKGYWEQTKNFGEVKVPQKCFTQIIRGDEESFNEAFYRSSYLAKERSKFVGGGRSFGSSRLSNKVKVKVRLNK
jgi:hypothetical protein|tara:strand:- start:312 stop:920 length:609 start_codon:yes stop_codon:yes gene_type:complete